MHQFLSLLVSGKFLYDFLFFCFYHFIKNAYNTTCSCRFCQCIRNSGNRGYSTLALIILLIFVLFLEFQISLTCFLSCALAAGACSKIKEKKSPIYSICAMVHL
ncbi:unnamed protein product [Cuscuta epithymum]|uniref:Uncharacterized protein n=1 Tax=Cuscuta epithymum TaxID=186058 RepID=A0AAV0FFX8_9ASTE|nr:unnamed protein product [Cuscuta epithymum]